MQRTRPLVLALLALGLSPAIARADDARIIVQHRPGLDASERAELRADADTRLDHTLRLPHTEVVTVTDGTRAQAIAALRSDPDVVYAETDERVQALTNDPYWPQLWGMFNPGTSGRVDADIDAEQAWTASTGAGITVGVVDTGVQANHPDLGGRVVTGLNTVTNTTDTTDGAGHGTHVAGIIGATAGNGVGVAGIAPDATIEPLKVFTGQYAYESDIAEAFAYAGQHGVQVVNASLGGYGATSSAIVSAMTTYPNTLYVVAAGNNGTDNDRYPVSPCVNAVANELCVGASTIDDTKAWFSNYGASTVDLFAPGVGIASTYPGSGYQAMDGTSMATPYVAGTAALVASITSLRGAALAERLKASVDHPAGLAGLSVTGGRLNAARAVGALPDAPSRPVVLSVQAGTESATLTMSGREADIAAYLVYDAATGAYVTSATSPTIAVGGLGAGRHDFAVVARNTSGQDSPASAVASVVVAPVAGTAPTLQRSGTATVPAVRYTGAPFSAPRILTRRGWRPTLTFRVTRTARVTVTLAKRSRSGYRATAARTIRLVPGLQSLPITSRLLGMRVPAGAWRVTLSSGSSPTATVAFTRR
jgi:subtilisin family serine protease